MRIRDKATMSVIDLCHKRSVSGHTSCLVGELVEPISTTLTSIRASKVTHLYELPALVIKYDTFVVIICICMCERMSVVNVKYPQLKV